MRKCYELQVDMKISCQKMKIKYIGRVDFLILKS